MRVLACCDYFHPDSPGGAERVAAEVYRRAGREPDVEVCVAGAVPRSFPAVNDAARNEPGVRVQTWTGWDLTRFLGAQLMVAPGLGRRFDRLVAEHRPDVVHVNGLHFHSTVAGLRAARRAGVPVVATAHLGDVSAMPGRAARASVLFDRVVGGRAARAADEVLAVAANVRDHLVSLGVPRARITVVENGVDHVRFHARNRPPRTGTLRAAYVGRLVGNKGPFDALDAVAVARAAGHDVHLDVYGDGPLSAEVRRRAASAPLEGHVTVHGPVDDVDQRLRAADVLLRPSYSEGLPLAVLEAMACGAVVVSSDVAGNAELVGARDGEAPVGIVVPVGDVAALARALGDLAGAPDRLDRLATAGVRRAGTFTWDRSATHHVEAWRRVVAGPGSSGRSASRR